MLPRLQKLTLWCHELIINSWQAQESFLAIFRRIAVAAAESPHRSSFPYLTQLDFNNVPWSIAAPLIALPSVEVVSMDDMIEANEDNPFWPENLPRSRAKEVRLLDVEDDDARERLYSSIIEVSESCIFTRSTRD